MSDQRLLDHVREAIRIKHYSIRSNKRCKCFSSAVASRCGRDRSQVLRELRFRSAAGFQRRALRRCTPS